MPPKDQLEAPFRGADVSEYPAVGGLSERERVLWVLAVGKEKLGRTG